jgi:hypothetical protein
MFKHFTTTVIAVAVSLFLSAQTYVTLHEDCNYGGSRYFLEPGTYRLYQMKIDNDKLSSFQIPSGMKVTIYENDDFRGKSKTFTGNISCLEAEWNDMASSLVVEGTNYQPGYNQNDYVTFYTDCYSRGTSRTLRPGTYSAAELGAMKQNISSFTIYGNMRVRAYINSDNASGYFETFDASQSCLGDNYNDKIRSLVVEYRPANAGGGYGGNNNNRYAVFYTDCNYEGNSIRLQPGYYQGDKMGLFRYDISSAEVPSGLRVKVYTNESLSGSYNTLTENTNCFSYNINNRIGSLVIEEAGYGGYNNNPPPGGNVMIYTDANYRGQSATLLPGTYATMSQAGFPDNALSSLTVPAGFRVVLYEFENFGGKTYTITESKSGFIISGWNDKTSSIAVYRDR